MKRLKNLKERNCEIHSFLDNSNAEIFGFRPYFQGEGRKKKKKEKSDKQKRFEEKVKKYKSDVTGKRAIKSL